MKRKRVLWLRCVVEGHERCGDVRHTKVRLPDGYLTLQRDDHLTAETCRPDAPDSAIEKAARKAVREYVGDGNFGSAMSDLCDAVREHGAKGRGKG